MKEKINTLDNKTLKEIDLDKSIFSIEIKDEIIYRMVRYQLSKRRSGTTKLKVFPKFLEQQKNLLSKKELVAQDRGAKGHLK